MRATPETIICEKCGHAMDLRINAAKILGRQGGLKGGKARAKAMSFRERRESAKKAAAARWGHEYLTAAERANIPLEENEAAQP